MNKNLVRILTYIKMSLFFMVLGSIVVYIAGAPIASYVIAQGNMIIDKGAPGYPGDSNLDLSEPIVKANGTLDQSEFQIPELDTQYGTITCDRIALTAPLYYGDGEYVLQNGAGQYSLSGMPGEGKPILIGGHDTTYFAPLESIAAGDMVSITADYGNFEYEVVGTNIADVSDTTAYDLTQDKEQLILYTCYPFGAVTGDRSNRFFVYCNRISDTTEAAE
ncbi:MAG: class D sortase [Herbinix sp.]|nr:class D sortase [Herbinix sp.]